jgi:hypothetical protein
MIPDDLEVAPYEQEEQASGFDTALSIFFAIAVGMMFALVLVVALTFIW